MIGSSLGARLKPNRLDHLLTNLLIHFRWRSAASCRAASRCIDGTPARRCRASCRSCGARVAPERRPFKCLKRPCEPSAELT